LPFLARHLRLEGPDHASSSDNARKRQRDVKLGIVTADRDHRSLVAENHFRDPRRNDADAELTGIIALDDGDIGVTNVRLDLLAHTVKRLAALLDEFANWHAGDAGA
jgi:hypothetical protein